MNFDVIGGAIVANEHMRIERTVRGRLGRGQSTPRARPARRRPGPYPGPAPGRRHGGDGRALGQHPRQTPSVPSPSSACSSTTRPCRAHLPGRRGPRRRPGLAHLLAGRSRFERIIFGAGTRGECSKTARFFTGATRRVIETRDLECPHEFCDLSADKCQIDHIVPFSQGGLTEQSNGQVLCGRHNRMRYERPPPDG